MRQTYCSHKRVTKGEYLSRLALRLCDELHDGLAGIVVVHDPAHWVLPNAYNSLVGYLNGYCCGQNFRGVILRTSRATCNTLVIGVSFGVSFKWQQRTSDCAASWNSKHRRFLSGMNPMTESRYILQQSSVNCRVRCLPWHMKVSLQDLSACM